MNTLVWIIFGASALVGGIAMLLTNIHTIRQKLGWYYPPISSQGIGVQMWGGYNLLPADDGSKPDAEEYGYPTTVSPLFGLDGFISTPSVEFRLTNKNDIDLVIDEMTIQIMRYPSPKFHASGSPLIASADPAVYEVIVGKHDRVTKCKFTETGKYLKLAPGEATIVRLYLRSEGDGYITVRPNYTYTIGGTTAKAWHPNYSEKIFFFHDILPEHRFVY